MTCIYILFGPHWLYEYPCLCHLEAISIFKFTPNVNILRLIKIKGKGFSQQAEVAQGVPGRLRPQIFLTFGTMRVVGHQPYTMTAFTQGEISVTHF